MPRCRRRGRRGSRTGGAQTQPRLNHLQKDVYFIRMTMAGPVKQKKHRFETLKARNSQKKRSVYNLSIQNNFTIHNYYCLSKK